MFKEIIYKDKKYGIMSVFFKKFKVPVLVDDDDIPKIKKISYQWMCNATGIITTNVNDKDIKLQNVIMQDNPTNRNIMHIDRLGIDNRKENLLFDTNDKDITKNLKKKKRRIQLPENCGIKPDELPTFVWYMKPDITHNERFIVKIGNLIWKSTSSSKVSLRYKLEETKAYLRKLQEEQPELFTSYSMNGDYNKKGQELLESFYEIIYQAGFDYIKKINVTNTTNKYISPIENMPKIEKLLLDTQILDGGRKNIIKQIPQLNRIVRLPKNCYYHKATDNRGDYFYVKETDKTWITSTSMNVPTKEKYEQLIEHITTKK